MRLELNLLWGEMQIHRGYNLVTVVDSYCGLHLFCQTFDGYNTDDCNGVHDVLLVGVVLLCVVVVGVVVVLNATNHWKTESLQRTVYCLPVIVQSLLWVWVTWRIKTAEAGQCSAI